LINYFKSYSSLGDGRFFCVALYYESLKKNIIFCRQSFKIQVYSWRNIFRWKNTEESQWEDSSKRLEVNAETTRKEMPLFKILKYRFLSFILLVCNIRVVHCVKYFLLRDLFSPFSFVKGSSKILKQFSWANPMQNVFW